MGCTAGVGAARGSGFCPEWGEGQRERQGAAPGEETPAEPAGRAGTRDRSTERATATLCSGGDLLSSLSNIISS